MNFGVIVGVMTRDYIFLCFSIFRFRAFIKKKLHHTLFLEVLYHRASKKCEGGIVPLPGGGYAKKLYFNT